MPHPVARLSHIPSHLANPFLRSSTATLPHSEEPVEPNSRKDIEANIRPADAEIPPSLAPFDAGSCEELVAVGDWAVLAARGGVRIVELAWCLGEVSLKVFSASLTSGCVEDGELIVGAAHLAAMQGCGCETTHSIRERRDAPHKEPEPGECAGALQDAVEREDQGE